MVLSCEPTPHVKTPFLTRRERAGGEDDRPITLEICEDSRIPSMAPPGGECSSGPPCQQGWGTCLRQLRIVLFSTLPFPFPHPLHSMTSGRRQGQVAKGDLLERLGRVPGIKGRRALDKHNVRDLRSMLGVCFRFGVAEGITKEQVRNCWPCCVLCSQVARRGISLPPMMSCISCALTPAWHPCPRLATPSKLALPTSRRRNMQVAQTLQGFHKRHAIAPAGPVVATLKLFLNTVLGSDTALVQRLDQFVQLWSLLHWWVLVRVLKPIFPKGYWLMRLWVTRSTEKPQ